MYNDFGVISVLPIEIGSGTEDQSGYHKEPNVEC